MKLKSSKFYIQNKYLYWKDPGGVLFNCLLENEDKQTMKEFYKGDCGGHHSWKVTANNFESWFLLAFNVFRCLQGDYYMSPMPDL